VNRKSLYYATFRPKVATDLGLFQPLATSPWKHHPTLCHPEEPTCLRQVKSEMNAEIDIDSIGFIFCSLGELVTFLIFRVFFTPNRLLF
jgi:hypothetical protein